MGVKQGGSVQEICSHERILEKIWSSLPSLRFRFTYSNRRTETQSCSVAFILHLPTVGQILSARPHIAGLSKTMRLLGGATWVTAWPTNHAHLSSLTCLPGWEMWLEHRWSAVARLACTFTPGGVCTTKSLSCLTTSTCRWSPWPSTLPWWLCSNLWSGMKVEVTLTFIPCIMERHSLS